MSGLLKLVFTMMFASPMMVHAALPSCDALAVSGPAQLIQYLKDGKTGSADPQCVEFAIRRLGEDKISEAIPVLASYLAFHRPETEREKLGIGGNLATPGNEFPAISALAQLGHAALPALAHVVEMNPSGSEASQNAVYTTVKIFGGSGLDAIHFLKRSAAAKSTTARQRLSEAAQQALTWCRPAEHSACQSALSEHDRL